jgi:hypothetical protein
VFEFEAELPDFEVANTFALGLDLRALARNDDAKYVKNFLAHFLMQENGGDFDEDKGLSQPDPRQPINLASKQCSTKLGATGDLDCDNEVFPFVFSVQALQGGYVHAPGPVRFAPPIYAIDLAGKSKNISRRSWH